MKRCRDCDIEKPLGEFPRNRRERDGHGRYCKSCFAIRYREYRARKAAGEGRTIARRRVVPEGQKYCPACESVLPCDAFGRNRASRDGLTAYCRPCHNTKGKANRTRLYGSTREYHLRRRYGIGQAEVDQMLAEQGGVCAVCAKPDPEHVDHDHTTGFVRGMLCFNCNQALGNVHDDPAVLDQLIRYLLRARLAALGGTYDEASIEGRLIEYLGAHGAA